MLKKQTVWLLTMLSLMIVLSVYYMSSPNGGDFAYVNEDMEENAQTELTETEDDADMGMDAVGEEVNANEESVISETEESSQDIDVNTEEGTVTSTTSSDQLFASIRMEREDERSKLIDQLDNIIGSSSASTTEVNEAYEEMKEIEATKTKEYIIEETLRSQEEYEDVLVRAEDEDVVITVKTDKELTDEEANEIMIMASDEFGQVNIQVESQPIS